MARRLVKMKPSFPITVFFLEDGDKWILEDEIDIAQNLEWFNSDDPEEQAIVTDKSGKPVRLVVENLELLTCEIITEEKKN